MDKTIITNPGELAFLKIGKKEAQSKHMIRFTNIIADKKPGWWIVSFVDYGSQETTWILDDDHIRGREFQMGPNNIPHQFCKIVVHHKDGDLNNHDSENLELCDSNGNRERRFPQPEKLSDPKEEKIHLAWVNPNPVLASDKKVNLRRIK